MTEEQIKQKAGKYCNFYYPNTKSINMIDACIGFATEATKELQEEIKQLKKKLVQTQDAVTMQMYTNKANKEQSEIKIAELEKQIEKMKCLKDVIIKAVREDNSDCVWEHAHNGKAKYIYVETVVDIINEKWE